MTAYKCTCGCCGDVFTITEKEFLNGNNILCSNCFYDVNNFSEMDIEVKKHCYIYGSFDKYLIVCVDTSNYYNSDVTQVILVDNNGNYKRVDITDIEEIA